MKYYMGVVAFLGLALSSLAFVSQTTRPPRAASTSLLYSSIVFEESSTDLQQNVAASEQLRSKLPPLRPNVTALEQEFRTMLEGILYTPQEINGALISHRLKAILHGISASYYEADVYRAFEVLYEDYLPLRVAGRIVYRKLQSIMEESQNYRQEQIESVVRKTTTTTNVSLATVESCWMVYVMLAKDQTRIPVNQIQQLFQVLEKEMEVPMAASPRKKLTAAYGKDGDTELEFDELMTLLNKETTGPLESMQQLLQAEKVQSSMVRHHHNNNNSPSLSKKERRHALYNQRYTEMLEKFGKWKAFIPSGEGRRLDILRGCFTGSENPKVVEALRVIYTDYNALRLSGDWIFNVVATIMNRRLHNNKQQ
mmetsp:Transcript_12316/g.18062  ORF Transcript_12316/g.18062 Transcript_12316/m.18062 type:complete len:368 (-) Transcript_12316:62-1165(-)